MKTKLFTTSALLATLLFSGCGGGTADGLTKQPHDTSKLGRTVAQEKDWTWDVSFSAHISALNDKADETFVEAHFWEGVPDDIENFQIFLDIDNDASTGYSGSDGWEIHGADYLIENGEVYRALSTTEWKWKSRGAFQDLNYKRLKGQGEYELLHLANATPTLSNIFTTNNFKVMIEAYDKNWEGDCNTITGINAEVIRDKNATFNDNVVRDVHSRYSFHSDMSHAIYKNQNYLGDGYFVVTTLSKDYDAYDNGSWFNRHELVSLYRKEGNKSIFVSDLLYRYGGYRQGYNIGKVSKIGNNIKIELNWSNYRGQKAKRLYSFSLEDIVKINNFPAEELGNKDTGIIGIDADFVNLIREG